MRDVLEALVDGGKATPGPPLGPLLGPFGVNVLEIVKVINEKTKHFEGMKVPVKIVIDPKTKNFEIEVGTPPTSALILKELGAEKGSGKQKETKAGNLSLEQVKKIAEMKRGELQAKTLHGRIKEVIGTCVSVGVTVDNKDPKLVLKELAEGKIKVE